MKLDLPIIPKRHHGAVWFQLLQQLEDYLVAIAAVLSWLLTKVVIPLVEGLVSGFFGSSSRRRRGRL